MVFSFPTPGKLVFAFIAFLIFTNSLCPDGLLAQADQTDEWSSYTLSRVNLRTSSSQQSDRINTLDIWTKLTVVSETDEWIEIRLEDGQTGWVASNYVIPRNIVTGLSEDYIEAEVAKRIAEAGEDSAEETGFTTREEPSNITELTESDGASSNFTLISTFLLGISIIVNMILFFRMRSSSDNGELITDSKKFQQDYNLLKKENHDLKDQIDFSDNKYAELEKTLQKSNNEIKLQKDLHEQELNKQKNRYNILEESFKKYEKNIKALDDHIGKLKQENSRLLKENESVNQKLGETSESIQEKVVKYTMAEQAHKEENLKKQNEINKLQSQISEIKLLNQQFEDELMEQKGLLEKGKNEFEKEIRELKDKLNEKEQKISIEVEKEKEKLSIDLEERFSNRMEDEKRILSERLESEKQNILKDKEELVMRNSELEKMFKDKNIALDRELQTVKELEKKLRDTEQTVIEKETVTEHPGLQAFEKLKKDHEQLLATFEEKKKITVSAENAWKTEKVDYLAKIKELEEKLDKAEKEQKTVVEELIVEEKPVEIKKPETAPVEAVSEIKKPEDYEQYVHSFFTKIKKL